jgi:hypothetical protein
MSTRVSIAAAQDIDRWHFYQEAADRSGKVWLALSIANGELVSTMPREQAIALFTELGKWAEQQKE